MRADFARSYAFTLKFAPRIEQLHEAACMALAAVSKGCDKVVKGRIHAELLDRRPERDVCSGFQQAAASDRTHQWPGADLGDLVIRSRAKVRPDDLQGFVRGVLSTSFFVNVFQSANTISVPSKLVKARVAALASAT